MGARVLLLRGVNVGARRLPMALLRELLLEAGLSEVQTYLQSGNAVVASDEAPDALARRCRELISERAGFDVPVVVRTASELEAVVAADPFGDLVTEAKHFWVTFFDAEPGNPALDRLRRLAAGGERVELHGRELYAWLPDGGGRSKLAAALPAPVAGRLGTARNWRTVTRLLEIAQGLEAG